MSGGKANATGKRAATKDSEDEDDQSKGEQAMLAHRRVMARSVDLIASNKPPGQQTHVNQSKQSGKSKANDDDGRGSAMGSDDEAAEVLLPVSRKRNKQTEDESETECEAQKPYKGRKTNAETPQAALLTQMNSEQDPSVIAKEYVARESEKDWSVSSLQNYDSSKPQLTIRLLDFWSHRRGSTVSDGRAYLNQDLFAVALSMMISLNGNPCLSQLIA
jgi:hypothetical protein